MDGIKSLFNVQNQMIGIFNKQSLMSFDEMPAMNERFILIFLSKLNSLTLNGPLATQIFISTLFISVVINYEVMKYEDLMD